MSVKRYSVGYKDSASGRYAAMLDKQDGGYVSNEDYAALEARCAALAAELQSVKAMNDCLSEELRGYESDGAFEGPKMHLLWWQCETPNHDAFLAEVRAQGVDMFASKCKEESKRAHSSGARDSWWVSGENADDFAANLRKGVQP